MSIQTPNSPASQQQPAFITCDPEIAWIAKEVYGLPIDCGYRPKPDMYYGDPEGCDFPSSPRNPEPSDMFVRNLLRVDSASLYPALKLLDEEEDRCQAVGLTGVADLRSRLREKIRTLDSLKDVPEDVKYSIVYVQKIFSSFKSRN